MAVISVICSWKPVHELYYAGKNNWPKATLSGNALLIIMLPFLHPWAILGSIFIFIGLISTGQALNEESNKTTPTNSDKPTPATPAYNRNFSSHPQNRSAKGKPPTGSIVCFGYTNGKGETSMRTIRVSRCGRTYLDGYDMTKRENRTFRLDRIHNTITDTQTGEIYYT
ncbi:WYL domain-containing protein [Neisseria wadsworthii]|uniref:WYL domain-containing protein n=1 Tax=Neisseria wadsworthii TaxID=607711 RepID=UPI0015F6789B|nr:WYL domain-containing protein [Neisseria wadsworthii]QMT34806.1 WYL domain-containing protein [Neisseria wadsworthii]